MIRSLTTTSSAAQARSIPSEQHRFKPGTKRRQGEQRRRRAQRNKELHKKYGSSTTPRQRDFLLIISEEDFLHCRGDERDKGTEIERNFRESDKMKE